MAKNSHIEWTHHTFNPWWGCTKVSPACDNCYAELWAKRVGAKVWGHTASRRFFGDSHWKEPVAWNAEAERNGERARVFCASMADVFERRADLNPPRERLWKLIESTPWLDWLLLTKRPQNAAKMVPWGNSWRKNVWIGTTVENQKFAELRLPHLLALPASVRFLSCEPLLGPIDLTKWIGSGAGFPIDWVIAGGESGPKARPMHPDWARGLMRQCQANEIAFHFKQWGHWVPAEISGAPEDAEEIAFDDARSVRMTRLPKKVAGRILEGLTWDQVPVGAS
ncbi:MAG TPA: phage Gp37/Gp68 family protein [Candidatus Didemnitutus sp.]|nr:phage Gp37/Gp68 family protein [Candidatus Didemnitutus sp.]